jgi:hypothetical protein
MVRHANPCTTSAERKLRHPVKPIDGFGLFINAAMSFLANTRCANTAGARQNTAACPWMLLDL